MLCEIAVCTIREYFIYNQNFDLYYAFGTQLSLRCAVGFLYVVLGSVVLSTF